MAHDDQTVLLEAMDGNQDRKSSPTRDNSILKKQRKPFAEVIPFLITLMAVMILAGYLLLVKY